jgi:hypothetical protein
MHRMTLRFLAAGIAAASLQAVAADPARNGLPRLSAAQPGTLIGACEELASRLAGLPFTTITAASTVPAGTLSTAGQPVPEHCRVTGRSHEHVSPVDGKTYAIAFEMRLPKAWNGRFYHQGNGGIDGAVVAATGALGGGPRTSALLQGFAVLSSDAGHSNAQGGPAFGLDPQSRLDYGYQAVGKLTPIAKQAIAQAYGKGPDRSYFGGCSNGGRHALVAAARYADEYDGFLVGAPGYRLPLAALANIWGAQRYATVATGNPNTPPGLETAFTSAERRTVANAVLARCDALDGATDGLIQAGAACQARFDFMRDVPTCTGARDGSCLTQEQKLAIGPIFSGATLRNGERFYAPFPFDSGIGAGGIPFWEFTAPLALDSGRGRCDLQGAALDAGAQQRPRVLARPGHRRHAGRAVRDQRDLHRVGHELHDPAERQRAVGREPARRQAARVPRRERPDLLGRRHRAWYEGLKRETGDKAEDFARLYRVPGMGHCSGGPATDQADFITPLVAWVEQGQAPHSIVASARGPGNPGGVNPEVPASWAADRTRPLCPYPNTARYLGRGDVERASSWACLGPVRSTGR